MIATNSDSNILGPVSVFCSYAHKDFPIVEELRRHLSPLDRSGLIKFWYDRQIGAGDEWRSEIDEHLEASEVVLLLISSDFVASNYCYEIEAGRALARHNSGDAIVIPIMARYVDIEGLPIADLQVVPGPNKPLVGTAITIDKAFADVCARIRSVIEQVYMHRLGRLSGASKPSFLNEDRELEGAIAHEISVGEYREVVVRIRTSFSQSLKAIIDVDGRGQYSCCGPDVRSTSFIAKYQVTAADEVTPLHYRLSLFAPSLIAEQKEKELVIDPQRDFGPVTFLVKAEREGRHPLRVNLYRNRVEVAETFLLTSATDYKPGPGTSAIKEPELVASLDMDIHAFAKTAGAGAI